MIDENVVRISSLEQVLRPTLVVREAAARKNINRMADKAARSSVRFRPHVKSHQSRLIASWFRQRDVSAITTSSLDMAAYFARAGWQDITVAFPVNIRELPFINDLAGSVQLNLLVESIDAVAALGTAIASPVRIWIKIDTGYGRTGIFWQNDGVITSLAENIKSYPKLSLAGLLSHAGHTYSANGVEDIRQIHQEEITRLGKIKQVLANNGIHDIQLSIGDTPSCSLVEAVSGVDEIRPGNFVYYDLMQVQIGSCQESDLAAGVACPVVAIHPDRKQLIVYGGAVHLGKDFLSTESGNKYFGKVALPTTSGWQEAVPEVRVVSLSQEHGIIEGPREWIASRKVGDLLVILPVHVCLSANLLRGHTVII